VAGSPVVTVGIPTFNRASLLRETLESVMAQTFTDFVVIVSDNASTDETRTVVRSFDDPRLVYAPLDQNIGMIPNFNRLMNLTKTDFLLLLPDDDLLHPEYLESVVSVAVSHPRVGVVHTGFDVIDAKSHVLERSRSLLKTRQQLTLETGNEYLKRSMRSPWTLLWSSILFRTDAIVKAGGLRIEEGPLGDEPLIWRIALDWDLAYLKRALVAYRVHADATTSTMGAFTGGGYEICDRPTVAFRRRIKFLDEAPLPPSTAKQYRAFAEKAYERDLREDAVRQLALRGGAGAAWMETTGGLLEIGRSDPKILFLPRTWRLLVAQLGVRRARRLVRELSSAFRPD
jgi:glycosyltransferase involved in cell wall biosynthesis